jgi:tetratricopeptide (TPR) repeat protein
MPSAVSSSVSSPAASAWGLPGWLGRHRLVQAVLFALAVLVYANTIPNKWAVDDVPIIRDNTLVQRGLAGVPAIFTHDAFYGYYQQDINALAGGRYRPLSPALFALEAELLAPVKKDAAQEVVRDAAGYRLRDLSADSWFPNFLHLQNALLFGLLCVVLYQTLAQLLRPALAAGPARADAVAALTTLLFALHPLHTEVVANVKSADELLSLLGALLALGFTLRAYDAPEPERRRWLLAAAGSFMLALLAKEMAATFVLVVPLALWFFRAAPLRRLGALCWPLALVLVLYGGLRTAVVGTPRRGEVVKELMNDPFLVLDPQAAYGPLVPGSEVQKLLHPTATTFSRMPYANELATNVYTYGRYLRLLVWPHPLTSDYYPREVAVHSWAEGSVWLALLLNGGLLGWALWRTPRRSPVAFGILFYFITFSLVSNLLFPVGTNMAERFLFMPSVGACLVAALLLTQLAARLHGRPAARWALGAGVVGACLLLAAATLRRNPQWHDNYTLFSHDALVSVNSGKIKTDLAALTIEHLQAQEEQAQQAALYAPAAERAALTQRLTQRRDSAVQGTLPMLRDALRIHPMSWTAWQQLGAANYLLAQTTTNLPQVNYTYLLTALAAYEQARFYQQGKAGEPIVELLSHTYRDLGRLVGEKYGDLPHAIAYLEQAKALNPGEPLLYSLLGTAYSRQADYPRAIENTRRSLELQPDDRLTRENLALLYQQYALAVPAQRVLLPQAERQLRQVLAATRALPDNDPQKPAALRRTLELLARNYGLRGDAAGQAAIVRELVALGSAAQ